MTPLRPGALLAIAVLTAPVTAFAQGDPAARDYERPDVAATAPNRTGSDEAPTAEPVMHWYGWQTLVVDLSAGALAGGAGFYEPALLGTAVGAYFVGGPIVHAAHGRWAATGTSIALRVGIPAGAAFVGAGLGAVSCGATGVDGSGGGGIPCYVVGAGLGAILGALTASLVDAFALATEPEPRASDKPSVAPTVSLVRGGGSVGLVGQF
jgi:hypothetical protein